MVFLSKKTNGFLANFLETSRCQKGGGYAIIYMIGISRKKSAGRYNYESNGGIYYAYANGFPLVWRGQ